MAERLAAIPEVLEVHTITGVGDMLCRPVARTNADLQRVLDAMRLPLATLKLPPCLWTQSGYVDMRNRSITAVA